MHEEYTRQKGATGRTLELEACALVLKYRGALRMFAPGVMTFLRKLADYLGWEKLKGELQ
jgi:hypothetical protein